MWENAKNFLEEYPSYINYENIFRDKEIESDIIIFHDENFQTSIIYE